MATNESLPPSAQLALLHAQAANNNPSTSSSSTSTKVEEDPFVPSLDDPVVDDAYEPLIAGDYPTPIGKPVLAPKKKEPTKKNLDLSSESAFPSLSASPRAPVTSGGWSSAAASRVKSPQVTGRTMAPPATGSKKASGTQITDVFKLPASSQIANMPNKPLGFKSNADVIQQVIKKTGTNIIASTNRSGTTTFIIQGTPNDVAKAKKELIAGLVVKRTVEIPVPASMRRFIIGPKGTTLAQIEANSYTRINFPRKDEEDMLSDDDMVIVTIMGEPSGIKVAKEEIEKIVGEKIGKQTIKIDNFDSKYYLFLAGVENSNIKNLEQEFNVKIHIPAVIVDGKVNTETAISITGDKDKVQFAKQALEKSYADIENTSRTIAISIPKRQHKYLYGKNGNELKAIFNASNCTVELPAADDTSDNVTIRGLEPNLVKGLTAVMEKANAVQVIVLDLAESYKSLGKDAPKYARAALRFLASSNSFKKVEDENNVMVSVPEDSVTLEFVSSSGKDAALAQLAVSNLVRDLTPDIFGFVDIKAYLHHYIATKHRNALDRIQSNNNVAVIIPDEKKEEADAPVLVVYRGEKGGAKAALDAASSALAQLVADSSDYISKSTTIPIEFHELIQGPRGTTLNAIIGETEAVVRFGPKDKVEVRGLTKDVSHAIAELQKAYEAVQQEDYAKPYTTEFFISPNFSAHIIGKSGSQINKLKEELGVKVDIGENEKDDEEKVVKNKKNAAPVKVVIQGPKINVEAAKDRINAQIASLADQVTLSLKVPKAFHRYLIGPSGRYVKKLEDKYNVFIKFPKSGGGAESPVNPDEITVRGSKKDANAAKDELMELYEYEKDEQQKRKEREQKHKEYEEKRAAEDKRRAEERAAREARDAAKEAAREARKAEKEAKKE